MQTRLGHCLGHCLGHSFGYKHQPIVLLTHVQFYKKLVFYLSVGPDHFLHKDVAFLWGHVHNRGFFW